MVAVAAPLATASAATPPPQPGLALLPLGAMALGLLLPTLAAMAERMTPLLLGATTLLGVLALSDRHFPGRGGPAPLRVGLGQPLLLVLGLGLLSPLLAWAAARLLGATAGTAFWVALAAGAPTGTGAIGLAMALGMDGRRVLVVVAATTAAAPLLLPGVALLGAGAALEPEALAGRLWLLTAVPALVALPLRRWPPLAGQVARQGCAGLSVLVLSMTALARMHGIGPVLAANPLGALQLLGMACLPGLAGWAAVLLVQRGRRPSEALLIGGYRNITLVWAACALLLPPEGNLLMTLTALPVFGAPALAALLRRRGW